MWFTMISFASPYMAAFDILILSALLVSSSIKKDGGCIDCLGLKVERKNCHQEHSSKDINVRRIIRQSP